MLDKAGNVSIFPFLIPFFINKILKIILLYGLL
jgi:hypothetical protein